MNSVLDRIPDTESVKDLLVKDPGFRALWSQYKTAIEITGLPNELDETSTGEDVKRVISELPQDIRVRIYSDMLGAIDEQLKVKEQAVDKKCPETGGVIHQVRSDTTLFRWVIKALVIIVGSFLLISTGGALVLLYASGKVSDDGALSPFINSGIEMFKILLDFFK